MRQIFLLLIPAAAATLALATPITRLIYQHGQFGASSTDLVVRGAVLVLVLPALQRRQPAADAHVLLAPEAVDHDRDRGLNLVVNASVSVALYKPLGIAGIVIGTAVASLGMTIGQAWALRGVLDGRLDATRTLSTTLVITFASALLGAVSWTCGLASTRSSGAR